MLSLLQKQMATLLQSNQQKIYFYFSFLCGVLPALAILLLLFFKNKLLQLPQTFAIKLGVAFCNIFINFIYFVVLFLHFILISYILMTCFLINSTTLSSLLYPLFITILMIILYGFIALYYFIIKHKKINLLLFTCIAIVYSLGLGLGLGLGLDLHYIYFLIYDDTITNIGILILLFILVYIIQLVVDKLTSLNNKRLFYYNAILFMPLSIFTLMGLYFKEKLLSNTFAKNRKIFVILLNIFIIFIFLVSMCMLFAFTALLQKFLGGSWKADTTLFLKSLFYISLFYVSTCIVIYLVTKFNKNIDFTTLFFIILLFITLLIIILLFIIASFAFYQDRKYFN